MHVEFKFEPGSKVINPLGNIGYIDSAAINDTGEKMYYVVSSDDSANWWAEKTLRKKG